jgi:hypothetical protein
MSELYPGYDVLAKRNTASWNEKTREVVDRRLAMPREPRFFDEEEWRMLAAACARILPQPKTRPPAPIAAMIDEKLFESAGDGYRDHRLPPMGEAWRRGLRALNSESSRSYGENFHSLAAAEQDALLQAAQDGVLKHPDWQGMNSALFFAKRLLFDVVSAYYSHPSAWNEIGFGGPAAPRGYVRMDFDRRDPWEAAEGGLGREEQARRDNDRIG